MRLFRPLRSVALAVLIVLVGGWLIGYLALRASLPRLDGNITVAQLTAPASIERDAVAPILRLLPVLFTRRTGIFKWI